MKGKGGQFSFVWIFAILAGGTILILAIWGAMQTGETLRYGSDTAAAKSIAILIDPLQAGFAGGKFGKIMFRQETRIKNICLNDGEFGRNEISVATRSGIGEEWLLPGGANSVHNKYIFSEERNEGFDFYVFSKPFEFPYEVSDLIFMSSGTYCFLGAPEFIKDDVSGLGIGNIVLDDCSSSDKVVCFGRGGPSCDISVSGSCTSGCDSVYDYGSVTKGGDELKYIGNLIWGAIFSGKLAYECNVERLMFRTGSIAEILSGKADLMNARNCGTNLKVDLEAWAGMTMSSERDTLASLKMVADALGRKEYREVCGMW